MVDMERTVALQLERMHTVNPETFGWLSSRTLYILRKPVCAFWKGRVDLHNMHLDK